jgi:hypothetical protein
LKRDGTLVTWGQYWDGIGSSYTPAYIPSGVSNVTAIANNLQYGPFNLVVLGNGAPRVVRISVGQTVATNATVTFNVAAVGVPSLAYQWRFNGTNIAGATDTALTLLAVQLSDEGNYSVFVSNSIGTTISSDAFLKVIDLGRALNGTNLVWTTDPSAAWSAETSDTLDEAAGQSGQIFDGQQSTLETTVTGPGTLTFWWKVSSEAGHDFLSFAINDAPAASISGAVGWQQQTFYLPDGPLDLKWIYAKDFSGSAGSDAGWVDQVAFQPGATLPTITSGPANRSVPAGSSVAFGVTAIGTPPLSYQWQFAGTDIPGQTGTSLSLVDVQAANAGTYSVAVSNSYGYAMSNAVLTVTPVAPRLTLQPTNQHVLINGTAIFSTAATGSEPFTYQWRLNGTNIPGGTDSILVLTGLQVSNSGPIQVVVSNAYGSATNREAVTLLVSATLVVAWGNNFNGQIIVPFTLTNAVNIAAGQMHNLALKSDGTVIGWGQNNGGDTVAPVGLSNVTAIAAGWGHSMGLKSNGTVSVWGNNTSGQTSMPAGLSNVIAIAAGGYHSLVVKDSGIVVGWGHNAYGQASVPPGLSNVVAVAAGNYHSLALRTDGTVVAWGNNAYGQTNVPPGLSNVVAVMAGYNHCLALRADMTAVGWGEDNYGQASQPGAFFNVTGVAAGGFHDLILDNNGNVSGCGLNNFGQITPPATLGNVIMVAAGVYHSVALERYELQRSAPRLEPRECRMTGQGFSLRVAGLSGHGPLIVYASPDLKNWIPFFTNAPSLGYVQVLDTAGTNQPRRFYRAFEQ